MICSDEEACGTTSFASKFERLPLGLSPVTHFPSLLITLTIMSGPQLQAQLDDFALQISTDSSSVAHAEIESVAKSIADILRVQGTPGEQKR